ncbi:MAG TPA: hypothetical protein VJQ61_02210 [Sinomonas sp.]|nr:hypothetical protein [Sinomonas sp.]
MPTDAQFAVGQSVVFRRGVKDPFLSQVRVVEGDTGEIVHLLPDLSPGAVVVKLESPRVQGFSRVVVPRELLQLAPARALEARALEDCETDAAEVVAAAEAVVREAVSAVVPPAGTRPAP